MLHQWLGKRLSGKSAVAALGGMAARHILNRQRENWEQADGEHLDTILERITAYDIAQGAGKLLAGALQCEYGQAGDPPDLDSIEARLDALIADMDAEDETHFDRARSRYLVSKALFYLEGFRVRHCRYERYQAEACALLQRNPDWQHLSRQDVFLGKPFTPEILIGTTHRLLLLLESPQLYGYLADRLEQTDLRSDLDYMVRLVLVTFGNTDEAELALGIEQWFREYREFKIQQTHQREKTITTSLDAVSGGLPGLFRPTMAKRLIRFVFQRSSEEPPAPSH